MNFLCIVAAIGLIAIVHAEPSEDLKKTKPDVRRCLCMGKELTLTDEMQTAEKTCDVKPTEDKETGDHKNSNMTCNLLCKYQAFELISPDNKVNKDKMEEFVKQAFPKIITEALAKDVLACADKNGADLSVKDGKCDSYQPLFTCIRKVVRKNCKEEGESKTPCKL